MFQKCLILVIALLAGSACSLSQTMPPSAEPTVDVMSVLDVPTTQFEPATEEPLTREDALPTEEVTAEIPAQPVPSAASNNPKPVFLPNCAERADWPVYTVVAGDTLAQIARRTSGTVAAIASANCLADANLISVGQGLRVPKLPGTVPVSDPPNVTYTGQVAVSPATFRAEANTYIVQPGGAVLLTWQGAPQTGVDVIDFLLLPLSPSARQSGFQTVLGSDSSPADGATITYAVPSSGTLGYPAAVAKKNGIVVSRSNVAFAIMSSDQVQACVLQVNVPATNLYSGPATTYTIVSTIAGSDTLVVIGRAENGWWQVTYPGAGSAWIDGTVVIQSGDCSVIPVAAAASNQPAGTDYQVLITPFLSNSDGWIKVQAGGGVELSLKQNVALAPVRVEYMIAPTGTGMTPTLLGSSSQKGSWIYSWTVQGSLSAHIFANVYFDDGRMVSTETVNVLAE